MVPEGWDVTPLGDLAEVQRGKFSARPRNDPRYFGGDIPFVQTGDVTRSSLYLTGHSQTLNAEGLAVSKMFPTNTILMTIAANIGDVALTTYPVACPDSLVGIAAKQNRTDSMWLIHALQLEQAGLDRSAPKMAQKNINLEVLRPLKLLAPPLPEQRKIADILSTWDQAIEKTEALLSNARTQKRALMQQLLTGKRRFPAFESEPWKEVRLGKMGKFRKGKGLPKTVVGPSGDYPCVLYGELYTTYGEFIGQTKSHTDVDDGVISEAGDILIPASTTTSGIDLAIASYVEQDGIRLGPVDNQDSHRV